MRHNLSGNRLGRNSVLRKVTIRDMAKATLTHQRIETTKAKAKEARKMIERLITLGKRETLAAKRKAFSILCDHQLVSTLFNRIAPRFKSRMGGYTRIIPLSAHRRGDNASLVLLELTEREIIEKKAPAKEVSGDKKSAALPDIKQGPGAIKKTEKTVKPEKPRATVEQQKTIIDQPKAPKSKLAGGFKKMFKKNPSGE